ncbi:MAG TPA: DUF4249 domain-containing protein [Mucilaginibacter sp.]|nr:DUF4249 domain-containing protein [Mucilaginibacter sp.]
MPSLFMTNLRSLVFLFVLSLLCCKKPYNPPAITAPGQYLVVEGTINSGSDSSFIKLSRTVNISSKDVTNPELNARVTIEGDQNGTYPLTEIGNGNYACSGLNLDTTHQYRLRIKTAGNKEYLSNYVKVLDSPPIDSISYDTQGTPQGPGLNIYANTHDQTNRIRYYRWEYQETWEFHSGFQSHYISNGDTVLHRDETNDDIYTCWQGDTSSTIVLGSSAKLAQGVIYKSPILSIASSAEKISVEYSILVKQYALSADAYKFYANLKKNTEQLGSIFDAQPSEISGNIHSVTTPSEPVIGYLCIGKPSSQRIFINKQQLPVWKSESPYAGCELLVDYVNELPCCYYSIKNKEGALVNQVDIYINYLKPGANGYLYIPVSAIEMPAHPPVGYTAATKECTDCTLRGTNKKPVFWK